MIHLRRSYDAATSLVDFYGFRDKGQLSVTKLQDLLDQKIEKKTRGAKRVFSYVQKHEFEGLLFSDTAAFGEITSVAEQDIRMLSEIRGRSQTPEDINDDPEGAPSKRIMRTVRGRKVLHGPLIAQKAGLATIRKECPGPYILNCTNGGTLAKSTKKQLIGDRFKARSAKQRSECEVRKAQNSRV